MPRTLPWLVVAPIIPSCLRTPFTAFLLRAKHGGKGAGLDYCCLIVVGLRHFLPVPFAWCWASLWCACLLFLCSHLVFSPPSRFLVRRRLLPRAHHHAMAVRTVRRQTSGRNERFRLRKIRMP